MTGWNTQQRHVWMTNWTSWRLLKKPDDIIPCASKIPSLLSRVSVPVDRHIQVVLRKCGNHSWCVRRTHANHCVMSPSIKYEGRRNELLKPFPRSPVSVSRNVANKGLRGSSNSTQDNFYFDAKGTAPFRIWNRCISYFLGLHAAIASSGGRGLLHFAQFGAKGRRKWAWQLRGTLAGGEEWWKCAQAPSTMVGSDFAAFVI